MKEYRLLAWPELPSEFQRTAHRRILSDMSARYMTFAQLGEVSGLRKGDLKVFLALLDGRGLLDDDGEALTQIQVAVQLHQLVHALPWQTEVRRALHPLPS